MAFDHWLPEAAAARGLSCALIHDGIVHEAIQRLDHGSLNIQCHLDYFALWHIPNDPYARLAQAVQDGGGQPINHPARSRLFTDKAAAHGELIRHRMGVPGTLIIRSWASARSLTDADKVRLGCNRSGAHINLKPANGFGNKGVIRHDFRDCELLASVIAAARRADQQDSLLVQSEIHCPQLSCDDGKNRRAYWRVLYCLGELIPFWWSDQRKDPTQPSYRRVSLAEVARHQRWPVLAYVARLAKISCLDWFSSEVCLSEGN